MRECMTQEDAMNMSNEQAIQILKPLRDMMIDQNGCPVSDAVFALDIAIKALEQRWIPCSERLPEKPNMYTVTDSKGDVVRFVFCDTESSREYWLRCAKAWMPLPEPYREEQE